jgi:hypothetical protein
MYDVDSMRLAILNAEIALRKNEYSHWSLVYGLEKPYLLTQ